MIIESLQTCLYFSSKGFLRVPSARYFAMTQGQTHRVYSSSSSLSPEANLLCPPGGVAGILLMRARDDSAPAVPLGSPGLGSAPGGLALLLDRLSPTVVVEADGEVDSRSTFFFGKRPSLATVV